MRRAAAITVVSLLGWLLGCAGHGVAGAQPRGDLRLDASVAGQAVGDGRLVIDPAGAAEVTVTVSNGTAGPVRVTAVRLSGTALFLTLFAYDTAIAFEVPPGGQVARTFPLDLAGLDRQVTGLMPVAVEVLGPDRAVLASVRAIGDVRGSMWSVYGVFGTAVVIVTGLAWASLLAALFRRRTAPSPAGGWRHAVRLLPAGVGAGLSAVILLAVLRLVPPTVMVQLVLLIGCAAAAFVLGHRTPSPPGPPVNAATAGRHTVPAETTAPIAAAALTTAPIAPAVPDDTAPDNAAPNNAISDNAAPDNAAPDEAEETARIDLAEDLLASADPAR